MLDEGCFLSLVSARKNGSDCSTARNTFTLYIRGVQTFFTEDHIQKREEAHHLKLAK